MATLEVKPSHHIGTRAVGEEGTLVFMFRYNRVRFDVAAFTTTTRPSARILSRTTTCLTNPPKALS